ncbi:MAG TPA: IclR family transcriptional regulator C-terminal domain-containing protein [Steroidobacteraceae bacterium]|nr:IclR family transcriptional regulator C-terminal domain-containing protein [Steroidobacteraceae bacterium]
MPVNAAPVPPDSPNPRPARDSAVPARPETPADDFAHSPDYVQSLHRGLCVIRAFDAGHASMTLSEVAARAGLSRAVARRLLMTLEYLGYVARHERQFSLTPRVLELGSSYLSSLTVASLAQPFMEEVTRRIDESCSLAVLDGLDIVYVQRVAVRKVMTITLGIGARLPAYCTSMGRMLLAGLEREELERWLLALRPEAPTRFTLTDKAQLRGAIDRVRLQDFAYVEQELQEGLCSVAVPVRDDRGSIVAALNSGMPFRVGARAHALKTVLPVLRAGASDIERALVGRVTSVVPAARR